VQGYEVRDDRSNCPAVTLHIPSSPSRKAASRQLSVTREATLPQCRESKNVFSPRVGC